jgi:2-polyprenyl-3-methyl-5-hydroxy-6-metoxy-1,4-benzoquinol methylase
MKLNPVWRCPHCRGELARSDGAADGAAASCLSCGAPFESFDGVLDLRPRGIPWIDYEAERQQARKMEADTAGFDAARTVRYVYASRPWDERRIEKFTRQTLEYPQQLRRQINGWLRPIMPRDGVLLDVGCGAGMLCSAVTMEGYRAIGLDASLIWLMVARKMLAEHGGGASVVAGVAEHLPLADESIDAVASLDVIEHVVDVGPYLADLNRVLRPGGHIALATPNRFSLAAEPHVSLWGVGWLPRRWQQRYVQWRIGDPYKSVQLLSAREIERLFRRHTRIDISIQIPRVSDEAIAHFPAHRRPLARVYNALSGARLARPIFRQIGPFFHIVGQKR